MGFELMEKMANQSRLADAPFGKKRDIAAVLDGAKQLLRLGFTVTKRLWRRIAMDDKRILFFH